MKNTTHRQDIYLLLLCFVVSRIVAQIAGLRFDYNALFDYWQYLDAGSLRNNLLSSLWYQHSQPPVFNLLLGLVLKSSASASPIVLQILWYLISFGSVFLLYKILTHIAVGRLPLIMSAIFLLSPATILFEKELFYTSFINCWLLLATYACLHLKQAGAVRHIAMFFCSLVILCLTRSMYHLVWLAAVCVCVLVVSRHRLYFRSLAAGAIISLLIVGGWYGKNYFIFGSFSGSSWLGMNFARIVFKDAPTGDSASIAAIHPFYPVADYKKYVSPDYQKFRELNDQVLLAETKQGGYQNMNHVAYLQISRAYMQASSRQLSANPFPYLKNVVKSFIIFFTPASSYYKLNDNSNRIAYYDALAGLNLSHFFSSKPMQKKMLVIAAIPILLAYLWVMIKNAAILRKPGPWQIHTAFILGTILFIMITGSLLEYGENMRYRYEIHPLFLILLTQGIVLYRTGMKNESVIPR